MYACGASSVPGRMLAVSQCAVWWWLHRDRSCPLYLSSGEPSDNTSGVHLDCSVCVCVCMYVCAGNWHVPLYLGPAHTGNPHSIRIDCVCTANKKNQTRIECALSQFTSGSGLRWNVVGCALCHVFHRNPVMHREPTRLLPRQWHKW